MSAVTQQNAHQSALDSGLPPNKGKKTTRALPASWYTSQEMYELERRAIFSKKWMLVSHNARFPKPGHWARYEIAGYQLIICRDRQKNINAFHNTCRHRAFPVATEAQGHSNIFSCKYHGWSYGLNGNLAKAPGYQDLEDFDKSQNGLLRVHSKIDHNGFIWINLDSNSTPEVAWDDDFLGVDKQPRF